MRNLIPVLFFVMLITSCGGDSENSETPSKEEVDTTSIDTLSVDSLVINVDPNRPEIDLEALLAKAGTVKAIELPLNIDSAYISQFSRGKEDDYTLSGDEAKFLSFDLSENSPTDMASYSISTFIRLDSINTEGDMEEYLGMLDIGQTRYSVANVVDKVWVSDVSFLLLWSVDYATYEACPYGEGTYVFATLFTNKTARNTTLVGELSAGGDPPSWGDTKVESVIHKGEIVMKSIERWGEEDFDTGEEFVDERKGSIVLSITPEALEVSEVEGFESPY